MNPMLETEIARADRLRQDSRALYERARSALFRSQEEIARAIRTATQLRLAMAEGDGAGRPMVPASRRVAPLAGEADGPSAYTVHLEGGPFSHTKRSAAAVRYRRSLDAHYRSAAAVVEALAATDEEAVERREAAMAYARWSALAPHEFGGPCSFVVRRGPVFESG